MPRDLLKELSADVDRLLAAGASAVAGDEGLSRRGRALHALADQVPALRPIAETIDRALAAEPAKSARALLDLLLMVRQARAALATAGVAGEIGPVEPSGPWESGLTSRDVSTAFAILDGRKPGRLEALQDLLGRGATPMQNSPT